MSGVIELEIVNWEKFNPRKDIKVPSWFRLDFRMIEDPDFYDFSHEEFKAWIYILSHACRKQSSIIEVRLDHAKNVCRVTPKGMKSAINKLIQLGHVRLQTNPRNVDVTHSQSNFLITNATRQDKTIQNITRQDKEEDSPERFEKPFATAIGFEKFEKLFFERKVKTSLQEKWLDAFPDVEWVSQEINKAIVWEESNPIRKKKNFGAFITRWLTKGWDSRKVTAIKNNDEQTLRLLQERYGTA